MRNIIGQKGLSFNSHNLVAKEVWNISQIGHEARRGVSCLGGKEYFSDACKHILLRGFSTISKLRAAIFLY